MASTSNTRRASKKLDITADLTPKTTQYLRCRFCRTFLLSSDKLTASHQPDARECGNCLYLDEEELSSWSWLQNQIEQSGWTKGRIYCPKKNCNARIGGFDYVQGVLCSCGVFTVPAIWIHGKVDIDVVSTGIEKSIESTGNGGPTRFHPESKPLPNTKICLPITKIEKHLTTEEVGSSYSISSEHAGNISEPTTNTPKLHPNKKDDGVKHKDGRKNSKSIQVERNNLTYVADSTKPPSNRFGHLAIEEPKLTLPPKLRDVNDHLTCPVCLDCFYKPYKCPCSHMFCEPCLRQLYHARSGTLKCPVCRSPVRYIEEAKEMREEIRKFHPSVNSSREAFEKTAKYKNWALPPIGPLSFLKISRPLVPPGDMKLIKLAAVLLSVVCGVILYVGLNLSGLW